MGEAARRLCPSPSAAPTWSSPPSRQDEPMTQHRIDIARPLSPTTLTARCECGDWVRSYRGDEEWSHVLDGAREHVASRCGQYQQTDNGQTGMISVFGRD